MKKKIDLLIPVLLEYLDEFMEVKNILGDYCVVRAVSPEEKETTNNSSVYVLPRFKIIKKNNNYYFRLKIKENENVIKKEFGPMPNGIVEGIFIPVDIFFTRERRKIALKSVICGTIKRLDPALVDLSLKYNQANTKKIEAVKDQNFEEAAAQREKEKECLEQLIPALREIISTRRRFKKVTEKEIREVYNNINISDFKKI